jgi:short-subunit dehydrogenase
MSLALVTGGTAGIGAAFAEQLAADGHDLVLVARGPRRLAATAAALHARHGVTVETLRADLTQPAGRAAVEARLTAADAPPVDVLVSNAGVQVRGEFLDADLERLQTELDVNVSAVLRMTHLALSGMVARGHGAVVLVSSFAGILPARGSAYGASRAWAVALADTVAPSLRGTGAQITVVCPGFVRTASLHTVPRDASFRRRFLLLAPDQVARRALADLRAGRTVSVPGIVYRGVWTWLELPRRALRAVARLTGHGRDRPGAPRTASPALPVPRRPVGSSPVQRQPTP